MTSEKPTAYELLTQIRDLLAFLVELEAAPDDREDDFPPDMPMSS